MACFKLFPPMWERLQRFRALDSEARGLFLRGSIILPLIFLSMRVRGFNSTQAALRKFGFSSNEAIRLTPSNMTEQVERTARTIRAAACYGLRRPTCLEKSLALWWLLRRQGITSSLRIGTRKAGGRFGAHAWIEHDGAALNELDEPHRLYAAFEAEFAALPPEAV
jgi:hypothetical protein